MLPQSLGNIVGRAAGDMPFGIAGLVQLGQHGLGDLAGKVIRVGVMGEGAREEPIDQ